jgi:hypothetical protein
VHSSLALRRPASSTGVQEIVDNLTAQDRLGEVITALRRIPARGAQWTAISGRQRPLEACEPLCIHYERRAADVAETARMARFALAELRRARRLALITPQRHAHWGTRFSRRLSRLESKPGRIQPSVGGLPGTSTTSRTVDSQTA